MLTALPTSWLSWDFRVLENGNELAVIDRHWFSEDAHFTLDGRSFHIRRTSLLHGSFTLEHDARVIAEARKPSAFRRSFDIAADDGSHYTLAAVSAITREFRVARARVNIGSIRPRSVFRRTVDADLPASISRPVQLFMVFLVLVLWKRAAQAAASGG